MALDEIRIRGLETFGHIGVDGPRQDKGQHFIVNAVLYADFKDFEDHDELNRTVAHRELCEFISQWMQTKTCKLIETIADLLAQAILLRYHGRVKEVDVELEAPDLVQDPHYGKVSVKVNRAWHSVYIGVASNIGDRQGNILNGIDRMKQDSGIKVMQLSPLCEYPPYIITNQDDFVTGVVRIETVYSPMELLRALQAIEKLPRGMKPVRWGPRRLDLDILFYDKLVMDDYYLTIPHIDMHRRIFVLEPMNELAPWFRHPAIGKTMRRLLRELKADAEDSKY